MTKVQSLPKAQPVGGIGGRKQTSREIRRMLAMEGQPRVPRSKTGTPAHILQWKQEAAVKKHLQKMPTVWLADQLNEKRETSVSTPLYRLAGTFANVWDLSQARRAELLAVPGVGPKGLAHLQEYLEKFQVQLKWDEPSGD